MEFFAHPWAEGFFGPDTRKFLYSHVAGALTFIPYGTMVDHFQHVVYEKPDMTPAERKEAWRKLEAMYRPHISTEGMPYLEEGTRWQYQMHIYETPFYYIDYCLAQTAAFCFLLASREDYDDAFARYLRLSRQGGEKVWTDLLEEAGFPSPFEPGSLKTLSGRVEALLEQIRV
jgi:oligoendopeptidase F